LTTLLIYRLTVVLLLYSTGLIIGTGTALKNAGPASILISYSIVGLIVYVVMAALGEMATYLPAAGGFVPYATRYGKIQMESACGDISC